MPKQQSPYLGGTEDPSKTCVPSKTKPIQMEPKKNTKNRAICACAISWFLAEARSLKASRQAAASSPVAHQVGENRLIINIINYQYPPANHSKPICFDDLPIDNGDCP